MISPADLQSTGLSTAFGKASALAGSFCHASGPFGLAAHHFVRRDILHVSSDAPGMAEGVVEFSIPISPKLVCNRHSHLAACCYGAIEHGVHIFRIEEQIDGIV